MANVHDFTVDDIHGKPVPLDRYKGEVLLIVNVASQCGFTPQYKGLEALQKRSTTAASTCWASPATSSARRSRAREAEIATFCETNFGVTFPLFAQGRRQRRARRAALPAPEEREPGPARHRGDQVELHQVPGRPRRAGARALRAQRHAGVDRRRTIEKRCERCAAPRRRLARARGASLALVASAATRARRTPRACCACRSRSPRPASTRRPPATSTRTTSTARSSTRCTATTISRGRTASCRASPRRCPRSPPTARWTIRIKPGIYFADDPAFKGRKRELVAADYVYRHQAHPRPEDALELDHHGRRPLRRRRGGDREGEGDRQVRLRRADRGRCRRSTATRCASRSISPTPS